jgi:hypothetical protein
MFSRHPDRARSPALTGTTPDPVKAIVRAYSKLGFERAKTAAPGEESSVLNWFRGMLQTDGGLNTWKMSLQWCRNVLRMVTPHMWICRALIQQVDRAALERVAHVTETNHAFKIASGRVRGWTISNLPCCQSYRLTA